ncbi:MAG: CHRD domain-containing protein [Gammaproteobacteria bacterium]|nr:CHRD domain-containing protein [Gammaproteobacteria bacterium]MDH5730270.1 CHRD domain-containing protein [Gammaproteobacteria bacterium]
MKKFNWGVMALIALFALSACFHGDHDDDDDHDDADQNISFKAEVNAEETELAGVSAASGLAAAFDFSIDHHEMTLGGSVTISSGTASTVAIYKAFAGKTSDTAVINFSDDDGDKTWTIAAGENVNLTHEEVEAFEHGEYYLNIVDSNGNDEMRAQILGAEARIYTVDLTPNASTASGQAVLTLMNNEGAYVAYVRLQDITEAEITGLHIHNRNAGDAVVLGLAVDGTETDLVYKTADAATPLTHMQIMDLVNGDFYVNVHMDSSVVLTGDLALHREGGAPHH